MNATEIGLLNEKPLHAALKDWYQQTDDRLEVPVDGYVIDIVRGDLLIEIQTGNFSPLRKKLLKLVAHHPVRLVYPITGEKWIVKLPRRKKDPAKRRKSPKRGDILDIFEELVSFPELLCDENFSLDILLIQEEEVRRYRGRRGWWTKEWITQERRLLGILEQHLLEEPGDLSILLPEGLPERFTTSDLVDGLDKPLWVAQKMAYCLRKMNVIDLVDKRGRSNVYALGDNTT
jgi:hypothetical protein